MNLLKNFSSKLRNESPTAPITEPESAPVIENEQKTQTNTVKMDSLDSKLISVVREVIESRDVLRNQVEEHTREVAERELRISEQRQEIAFYDSKIDNYKRDMARLNELIHDQKLQYEQLSSEFSAYRMQQDEEYQKLQEKLTERELTNRQLMIDLNRIQKDAENKLRDFEMRNREVQVKYQHLEEKYKQISADNDRMVSIINDFASQANSLSRIDKKVN